MLKSNQFVKVKWNGQTKKYWESKGYLFTKMGEEFNALVDDLQPKSAVRVCVICDYCGCEFTTPMYAYQSSSACGKIACKECKGKKAAETNIERYGVANVMQVDSIHKKMKASMLDIYGVEHPSQSAELHQKAMSTYDFERAVERRKQTCLEKYGVDNASKISAVVNKAKATCLERYGGESSQCDDSVRRKSWGSMLSHGTAPTSKAEREMVAVIKRVYGDCACYPQFVLDRISMDCLLVIGDVKIDIEYDGQFWHKDNAERDKRRDFYCIRRGYKVLRFFSKHHSPTEEQIKQGVDYLVNSEHKHLRIDI